MIKLQCMATNFSFLDLPAPPASFCRNLAGWHIQLQPARHIQLQEAGGEAGGFGS